MSIVANIFLLVAGLGALWGGTDLVIRGATNLARRYGVSELFIGLTILAIGSDLPELAVSIDSSFRMLQGVDTSGLIVGNAIGSAFGQFGFVLAVTGLVGYLTLAERLVFIHGGMLLVALLILFVAGADGIITRQDGMAMMATFSIFMVMAFKSEDRSDEEVAKPVGPQWQHWVFLVAGIAIVLTGSELTIRSALALAEHWGVRQSLVAIVLIGLGTSLPELSISIVAALRKQGGLSVGNLIGSNIFDTLVPVGLAGAISTVRFDPALRTFDLPYLFGLSLVVLLFFRRKRGLQKREALAVLAIYIAYLALKIMRY